MAEPRKGQEGSRWYNEIPDPKDLSKWFESNVVLHDGLDHKHYVQGVTMIPATEKAKEVTGFDGDGNPIITQAENLVYVPYVKVETRVKYFNDLMEAKSDEWFGLIEPVVGEKQDPNLPPGFFYLPVPTGDEKGVRFVCCTMKVTIYKREGFEEVREVVDTRAGRYELHRKGPKILDAPPATKMIPMLQSGWHPTERGVRQLTADPSSLMKAETGAIGRALGMAGMLVIPGTGVATAEDMAEMDRSPLPETPADVASGEANTVELPSQDQPPADELEILRNEAAAAIGRLQNEKPEEFKVFQTWAQERKIGKLSDISDAQILRGLTAKAQRDFAGEAE